MLVRPVRLALGPVCREPIGHLHDAVTHACSIGSRLVGCFVGAWYVQMPCDMWRSSPRWHVGCSGGSEWNAGVASTGIRSERVAGRVAAREGGACTAR